MENTNEDHLHHLARINSSQTSWNQLKNNHVKKNVIKHFYAQTFKNVLKMTLIKHFIHFVSHEKKKLLVEHCKKLK
jgi:hypothetical protein